jgi:hypothetical protein
MTVASFGCALWHMPSLAEAATSVCQVPDTSGKKEINADLCRVLDRTAAKNLQRLLSRCPRTGLHTTRSKVMMKKLRIVLAASLLSSALISNANAFTIDSDDALNPTRPKAGWCYYYWMGMWYYYEC